jgi:TonB family protein
MVSRFLPFVALLALASVLWSGCASSAPQTALRIPREPQPSGFEYFGTYDVEPRLRFHPRTVFPPFLVNQGAQGRATVSFLINAQGYVSQSKVDSASHEAFGASALSTVGRMVFHAATKDGAPVPVAARVTFVFEYEP